MSLVSVRRHTVLAISALLGLIVALTLLYAINRASAVDTVPVVIAAVPIATGTVQPALIGPVLKLVYAACLPVIEMIRGLGASPQASGAGGR